MYRRAASGESNSDAILFLSQIKSAHIGDAIHPGPDGRICDQHLDIASSADIKARRYQLTAEEVAAVRLWLDGCDIAWIKRNTEVAAERLESDLKAEYKPPLTRQ
jgi:hypothetical protein